MSKIKAAAGRVALGFVVLIPLAATIVACNTVAGAGKDVSAAGNATTNAANAAK